MANQGSKHPMANVYWEKDNQTFWSWGTVFPNKPKLQKHGINMYAS